MIYGSVCSGIEAATVAWHHLGWKPAFFSEIDKAACAVLKHHYPDVPLHGDFTTIGEADYGSIDLLVGGTPCQDFSVAGLRAGIAGDRGNLTLEFLRLAARKKPRWIVWENVPGVLSIDGGRTFGAFLGGLAELGYGFAYRVLDAQYFGLAQRRARVFVVGHLGDWRRAAAVLFERESLLWDSPPSRETGERVAPTISARTKGGGGLGTDFDCDGGLIARTCATLDASFGRLQGASGQDANHGHSHLLAFGGNNRAGSIDVSTAINSHGGPHGRLDFESETFIAQAFKASHFTRGKDGAPSATVPPLSADADKGDRDTLIAFSVKDHGADAGPLAPTLRAGGFDKSHANGGVMPAVCFDTTQVASKANRSNPKAGDPCHPLAAGAHAPAIAFDARQSDACVYGDVTGPMDTKQPGPAVAFSIMPMNSGKDYKARLTDVAQPIMAGGPTGGNQGGDFVSHSMQVRRLTPRECERLQGFPDDYTLVLVRGKPAADGPRYKQLGNSMATKVMAWIGQRIQMVEGIK